MRGVGPSFLNALFATSAVAVLLSAGAASAQTEPAPAPADPASATALSEIVVTGTRIRSTGFTAPTPTQVLGQADLERAAQPNIFTAITQLPSLQGSTGATTGTFSTSSGQQGLSSFSLRGLGTIRTLTLLDGQRVVPANVTGVPDISLFPQLLVERVDVVTGGASASYGSDAVGGVVNFITNKKFEGFKANVLTGVTTYGDNHQWLAQVAAGKNFMDDRLHVQVSGEYDWEEGVPAGGFGEDAPGSRDWYTTATLVNRGVTNDGSPQYLYREHAQAYQYTKYGLISNGPLQGTAFDLSGNPFQFQYGGGGVPAKNAAGTVSGCYSNGGFCVGGDLSGNVGVGTSLQSRLKRMNAYTRVGFDLDANNEIYATFNAARVESSNQPNPGAATTNLTMSCSNPYLPASVVAACAANGITTFNFGTSNAQLPRNISVHPTRTQYRGVIGADGKFNALGKEWRYDAYYEHGENTTNIHVRDILLMPRYRAAIQATTVNGQIVCADPVARANGCVPINIFGGQRPSDAALAYITPTNGPYQHSVQKQDVASINFSGEPFSLWAGPVSLAFGGEWRKEQYHVQGDPYGDGNTDSPNTADYPADPVLTPSGANWFAGNYHSGAGEYSVKEAYAEVNIPLVNSEVAGKANLNMAGRWTDYSTSGTVYTWKVGGTWDTPVDGVRLRAVTSRDVRAPNLSELFAAPVTTTLPNFTNPFTGGALTLLQNVVGNPDLKPEIAKNTTVGVVLSNPRWLPGFSVSVDWYNIVLNGGISSLGAQQIVNFCFSGLQQFCGAFNFAPAQGSPYVNAQTFNLASIKTSGFDIESSYRFEVPSVPGRFTVRGLATNTHKFVTNPGIPGAVAVDSAGQNSGATPDWKFLAIQSWDTDRFALSVQERWFSDGTFGGTTTQYVECQAGSCPVSTASRPTIDYNHMKGATYVDVSGSYKFGKGLQAYFKVDNLLNRDPTPSPQTNTGLDANPALYDLLGRFYHVGLRYSF
ncbi:TonB-dependent receptor plug domain-containing protein [Caulobacter rhizosphaerae]|jgi:outer membrane receptor protein involved in Fe transport|uniref:TonB-dependent receptor plug domain-containing protein n=1 Tax=Caulobacter rhizosphaerae TaxID=2010972 RepID=UPI0013D6C308|nr:TonB-dependent receptor [Caulobacter rhizosphaerae]